MKKSEIEDRYARFSEILSEMRDPQQLFERCRCGGADCDVVDPMYVGKIYANLVENAVLDLLDSVAKSVNEIAEEVYALRETSFKDGKSLVPKARPTTFHSILNMIGLRNEKRKK